MWRLIAPFAVTKVREKIAYCNKYVIPLLIDNKIKWNMNERRIIFCGRRFLLKDIDNGEAEEFIKSLIRDNQSTLDLWK